MNPNSQNIFTIVTKIAFLKKKRPVAKINWGGDIQITFYRHKWYLINFNWGARNIGRRSSKKGRYSTKNAHVAFGPKPVGSASSFQFHVQTTPTFGGVAASRRIAK